MRVSGTDVSIIFCTLQMRFDFIAVKYNYIRFVTFVLSSERAFDL